MEGYIRVSHAISDQIDTIIESTTMTTPDLAEIGDLCIYIIIDIVVYVVSVAL